MIKKKCSNEIKNLFSVVRNNDEFDIVGIIYSVLTKESDFCQEGDGSYTHKEVYCVYTRIKETYGEQIKFQLLRFLEYLKEKYFLKYEDFIKQKNILEHNLIIEKEKNKIPQISNGFNSQFIVEKIFCFCEEEKEKKNVRNK